MVDMSALDSGNRRVMWVRIPPLVFFVFGVYTGYLIKLLDKSHISKSLILALSECWRHA